MMENNNRLKIFFGIFFLLYTYFAFSENNLDLDFSEKKMKTENMVYDQINSLLQPFFNKNEFNISVHSEIRLGEVEKKFETETNKDEIKIPEENKESEISKELDLPGFAREEAKIINKSEKIRFYSYLEIVKIEIILVLEETLKASRKDLAKKIVTEKINSSYGEKASFSFREGPLIQPKTIKEEFSSYIRNHKDVILIFSIFMIALFSLFTLFNKMIASKDAQNMKALTSLSKSSMASSIAQNASSKVKDNVTKEQYIEEIMKFVQEEPFVARASFECLSVEEKSSVVSSVETDLLKDSLLSMMNLEEKHIIEISDEAKLKTYLKHILDQMKENVSIQKVLMNQIFGYLNYLSPKEIILLLDKDKTPKNLAILSQYMPPSKYYEFSKLINEEEKIEIFKIFNNKDKVISELDKKELNDKLKVGLSVFADKILSTNMSTNDNAIENFLNHDPKIASVVNALKKDSSYKFSEELEKYTMTFSSSLKERFPVLEPIILNEDNSTVAASLYPLEDSEKNIVLNKFGKMRKEIVEGLLKTSSFSEEDIDMAQAKILKVLRDKV